MEAIDFIRQSSPFDLLDEARFARVAAGGTVDDSVNAYGISMGGKLNCGGKDSFRLQASYGTGIGRYIGLNLQNAAVLDQNGKLEAIDQLGAFVSYLHYWNDKWTTSANVDYLAVDNPVTLTGQGANESAVSYSANLQYHPTPKMWVGGRVHARHLRSRVWRGRCDGPVSVFGEVRLFFLRSSLSGDRA